MGCEMGNIKVVMNKPVYLGQAILDLRKTVMYEFHHNCMVPKYGENFHLWGAPCLTLCYTDTDSLVYHIKTKDFYTDITDDVEERLDTSSYLIGHGGCPNRPLPVGMNKKVIRLMKDELGGAIMTEFVAMRPKLYSCRKLDGTETPEGPTFAEDKKFKGIKKCVIKKTLTFEDYKNCLLNPTDVYRLQLMFRSSKHKVHTVVVNKVALNRNDDKWISKKNGISTLARGHKSLSWIPLLREVSLR